jgi:hypothetical protein
MKKEHEGLIRGKLKDKEEQGSFISKCAEFLDYVEADCQGLSPGPAFFEQSAFGLRHLAGEMPRYKQLFEDAAGIYDTLRREVPGAMYPPGSQMFSDLQKVGSVRAALRDAAESEWEV